MNVGSLAAGFVLPGTLALAACGNGSSSPTAGSSALTVPASSDCAGAAKPASGVVTQAVATTSYYMVADVGPEEQMYTSDQVTSMHPSSGEVMMGGQMSSGASGSPGSSEMGTGAAGGMSGSGGSQIRHVEVHICSRSSGKAVTGATPTMGMADSTGQTAAQSMAVAVMQGVGMGAADMHYGNNMAVVPGHYYTITCTLNGQTGTFHMRAPS